MQDQREFSMQAAMPVALKVPSTVLSMCVWGGEVLEISEWGGKGLHEQLQQSFGAGGELEFRLSWSLWGLRGDPCQGTQTWSLPLQTDCLPFLLACPGTPDLLLLSKNTC